MIHSNVQKVEFFSTPTKTDETIKKFWYGGCRTYRTRCVVPVKYLIRRLFVSWGFFILQSQLSFIYFDNWTAYNAHVIVCTVGIYRNNNNNNKRICLCILQRNFLLHRWILLTYQNHAFLGVLKLYKKCINMWVISEALEVITSCFENVRINMKESRFYT